MVIFGFWVSEVKFRFFGLLTIEEIFSACFMRISHNLQHFMSLEVNITHFVLKKLIYDQNTDIFLKSGNFSGRNFRFFANFSYLSCKIPLKLYSFLSRNRLHVYLNTNKSDLSILKFWPSCPVFVTFFWFSPLI